MNKHEKFHPSHCLYKLITVKEGCALSSFTFFSETSTGEGTFKPVIQQKLPIFPPYKVDNLPVCPAIKSSLKKKMHPI